MNKNTIWILVAVAIVVAALFFIYGSGPQTALSPGAAPSGGTPSATEPPVVTSDNPDTIVDNILNGLQITPTPIESDPSLTAADTDITSGFDQAADTTNL